MVQNAVELLNISHCTDAFHSVSSCNWCGIRLSSPYSSASRVLSDVHPNLLRFAALAYFHFDASRSRGKKYERKRMKNKFYGAFVGCNEVICASYADAAVKNPHVIHMQNIKRFR